jgi:hypothetical protein
MLEIIEFLFSGFWVWFGGLIYLSVIATGLAGMFSKINYTYSSGVREDDEEEDHE